VGGPGEYVLGCEMGEGRTSRGGCWFCGVEDDW
jgi:radical SAM superfamily enzyme